MPNVTWSTTDKGANATLSGGNLTATAASATNAWVRATDRQLAGKFYWENRATVWTSGNTGIGFGLGTTVPSGAVPVDMVFLYRNTGAIWVDNVANGVSLGARASNDIIGMAVDFSAQLAWFRVAPTGNWNGSASANPATGVGGFSIPFGGIVGISAYPVVFFGAVSEAVVANFGDTAFSGAVPAGFTSGFPAGAALPALRAFVEGVARETLLLSANSALNLGLVAREALVSSQTAVMFDVAVREALLSGATPVMLDNLVRETMLIGNAPWRVSTLAREALITDAPPPLVTARQTAVTVNTG